MIKWLRTHYDVLLLVAAILVVGTMLLTFVWAVVLGIGSLTAIASVGVIAGTVMTVVLAALPEDLRSFETERNLRVASDTMQYMRMGLTTESALPVTSLMLPETRAIAIAMTNTEIVLAYRGEREEEYPAGTPIRTPATVQVLESGELTTFDSIMPFDIIAGTPIDEATKVAGIVAPLIVHGKTVGTIKFYYRRARDINRTQLSIARGFSELLSSQLSVYELDRQAELTARAEIKALQAQINPHFLFNTINTIAAFTRTDPDRARNLLRDFAVFYRETLENSEQLIMLARELEQTERYLLFEHARFGDERIVVTTHIEEGCEEVLVPSFIIQPLVENAVRHAMDPDEPLHVDIYALTEDHDVLISVSDDGVGMPQTVADGLVENASASEEGTGIALRNITARIIQFYDPGSSLEIVSREGVGTCVTIRLVGAAPQRMRSHS